MKPFTLLLAAFFVVPQFLVAQVDDMYFVPKKKKVQTQIKTGEVSSADNSFSSSVKEINFSNGKVSVVNSGDELTGRDVDEYNRRYAFAVTDSLGDVQDTLYADEVDGVWANGFDGSESDYEYARRLLRFRSPSRALRYGSSEYWDLVYGPYSSYWNVYTDGVWAYSVPTWSNPLYYGYLTYGTAWSGLGWGWSYYPYSHYHFGWYDPWYGYGYYGYPYHSHYYYHGFGYVSNWNTYRHRGFERHRSVPGSYRNYRGESIAQSNGSRTGVSRGRVVNAAGRGGAFSRGTGSERTGNVGSDGYRTGVSRRPATTGTTHQSGDATYTRPAGGANQSAGGRTGVSRATRPGYTRPSSTRETVTYSTPSSSSSSYDRGTSRPSSASSSSSRSTGSYGGGSYGGGSHSSGSGRSGGHR